MYTFIALVALIVFAQGASLNNRIVGGENATPGQFPFFASLRQANDNFHFCGATIIGSRTLLTSASCKVIHIYNTIAVVGTSKQDEKGQSYKMESFKVHEQYDPDTNVNDIAVVTLTQDIAFGDLVKPAKLASHSTEDNERLTTAGWGRTSLEGEDPVYLQWMETNVISHSTCIQMTEEVNLTGKICTFVSNEVGMCYGDAGGALVNDNNEVVGVASTNSCESGSPDLFTDVFYFKDWIIAEANL